MSMSRHLSVASLSSLLCRPLLQYRCCTIGNASPTTPATADHTITATTQTTHSAAPAPVFSSAVPSAEQLPPTNKDHIQTMLRSLRSNNARLGLVVDGKSLTRNEAINYVLERATTAEHFHHIYFALPRSDPRRIAALERAVTAATNPGLSWYLLSFCLADEGSGQMQLTMPPAVEIGGKNYTKVDALVESIRHDPQRYKAWSHLARALPTNGQVTLSDGISYDRQSLLLKSRSLYRALKESSVATLASLTKKMNDAANPAEYYEGVASAMAPTDVVRFSDGRSVTKLELTAMACAHFPSSVSCWTALTRLLLSSGHTGSVTIGNDEVTLPRLAASLVRAYPRLVEAWCLLGQQWINNEADCNAVTNSVAALNNDIITVPPLEKCLREALLCGVMSAETWIFVSDYLRHVRKGGRFDVVLHATGRPPGSVRCLEKVDASEPRIALNDVEYDQRTAAVVACLLQSREARPWLRLADIMEEASRESKKRVSIVVFDGRRPFTEASALARGISVSTFPVGVALWERLLEAMHRCKVNGVSVYRTLKGPEQVHEIIRGLKGQPTNAEAEVDSSGSHSAATIDTADAVNSPTEEESSTPQSLNSTVDEPVA